MIVRNGDPWWYRFWLGGLLILATLPAVGEENLPIGQSPVDYFSPATEDRVAELIRRKDRGEAHVPFDEATGYLRGLLDALDVPVESQLLVFSKGSVQQRLISPATPRAIYFNTEVSVAWIPGAPQLEVMAQDPHKGSLFYLIPQTPDGFRPRREQQCLSCHVSSRSVGVPGFLLHSLETDEAGKPVAGFSPVSHRTEVARRWGGWYVSGTTSAQPHRGNLIGRADVERHAAEPLFRGALTDLSSLVVLERYPARTSDVAAHLVLDHLAHGSNLLVRLGMERRLGRTGTALEDCVAYLLLLDEAPLAGPIRGAPEFQQRWERQAPRTADGRSLYELELQTRLFRWGVSPLVASRTFQALPDDVRAELAGRLTRLLDGRDPWPAPERDPATRAAALEILRAVVPGWP